MLQISISAAKVPKATKAQWDKMNTAEKKRYAAAYPNSKFVKAAIARYKTAQKLEEKTKDNDPREENKLRAKQLQEDIDKLEGQAEDLEEVLDSIEADMEDGDSDGDDSDYNKMRLDYEKYKRKLRAIRDKIHDKELILEDMQTR